MPQASGSEKLREAATIYETTLRFGSVALAELIADAVPSTNQFTGEERELRRAQMKRAVAVIREDLALEHGEALAELIASIGSADRTAKVGALIDLSVTDPFAPFLVRFEPQAQDTALRTLGTALAVDDETLDLVSVSLKRARATHNIVQDNRSMLTAGGIGCLTITAMVLSHGTLLPFIGHAHGAAGAAALNHALNVISLGHGMTGGIWVIAMSTAIVTGERKKLGVALMESVGETGFRNEILKAQAMILSTDPGQADERISEFAQVLADWEEALLENIAVEEQLNDPGSPRVKERKKALKTVRRAMKWTSDPSRETRRDAAAQTFEAASKVAKQGDLAVRETFRDARKRISRRLQEEADKRLQ
jgi:hypothetical protein